jgi:protein Tob/BTG
MRLEIQTAVEFIGSIMKRTIEKEQLELFARGLRTALAQKYHGHWHPAQPDCGSAYRCINWSKRRMDPSVREAAELVDILQPLRTALPNELTVCLSQLVLFCVLGLVCCLSSACLSRLPRCQRVVPIAPFGFRKTRLPPRELRVV